MRVLIGGKKELATTIRNALRSHYYVVDWVGDGQEAWDYLRYPDACTLGILDWSLPKVSGLDLCKKLRGQDNDLPLLRRSKQIRPQLLEVEGIVLDYQSFTLQLAGYEKQCLMAKEFQLLEYLMTYPNQVLTHEQIQVRLWG